MDNVIKKKGYTMNKQTRNTAIISVVVTLVVVVAFASTFVLGMNYQKSNDAQIQSAVRAATQVK